MAVPVPNLDNRTFEQLLKEAMRSIPHYALKWTNHNPADPGITLIELFAWLAEIISYRVNLVTEEHLLKYLKLLGIRPQGSQSAITDLSFEAENDRVDDIVLGKGTVFLAEKNGERIEFELLEDIDVVPIQLKRIIANEIPVDSNMVSPQKIQKSRRDLNFSPAISSQVYPALIAEVLDMPVKASNYVQATGSRNLEKDLGKKTIVYGSFERSHENTNKDLFFAPFGLDTRKNSKLYLGFDNCNNEAKGPESLNFMCYSYEKDLIEPGKHGDELEYEFEDILKWEISTSNDGKQWDRVFPKDGTLNFRKSGSFFFPNLKNWERSQISDLEHLLTGDFQKKNEYFWLRCTLLENDQYEYPPRIESIRLNTAPVIQKKRLTNLVLGKSDGLPGQIFKLPETPVLRRSLKLALADEWNEVEDFDGSKPESAHFILDSLKGEIRFGDGLRGKIPTKDTEIRVIKYEIGRGECGNLPADSNWIVKEKSIEGLKKVFNLEPATGGKDEESIDKAFERFIKDLRVPYRAVTSEDFEYIARETPGLRVAQAKAIPNFNPHSKTKEDGIVTVVVIPFSPLDTFKTPPRSSKIFRKAIAKHLEEHRLLGTLVYVVSPVYVRVEIQVILGISKGFSEEKIKKDVRSRINLFLHPTKGDFSGNGWPVGKNVYRSEIHQLIMEIEGVDFVEKIEISAQKNAKLNENGDLELASKIATVYSGEHSVEISGTPEQIKE